jgi:hypothetical protein
MQGFVAGCASGQQTQPLNAHRVSLSGVIQIPFDARSSRSTPQNFTNGFVWARCNLLDLSHSSRLNQVMEKMMPSDI